MDTATDTVRSNNRRIARNTLLLYIRMFITILIGFYTSRVVLNVLGVVDYGIYNVVGGIVSSLAVLNGSMAGATQRWITFALGKEDENYLKKVFSVAMTSQAIIAGVVLVLVESIGLWYLQEYAVIPEERMTAAFWTFQISVFTMVLGILNVPFNGTVTAHEKMGFYALTSIVDVSLKLLMCLALYLIESDKLIIYAGFHAITAVIVFIWVQIYCRKNFMEVRGKPAWDRILYKKMLGLAFWNTSDNLAYMGYTQGTTLLINLFFGTVMNAAAGLATHAAGILDRFRINFQVAMNPQITKYYAQEDYKEMHKLIFRSAKFSCFILLFLAVPFFYEAHILLRLWLGSVPEHTVLFMRLDLCIPILMSLMEPLKTAALATGKVKNYQLTVNGILMMIPLVLYVLYKSGAIAEISVVVFFAFMSAAIITSASMLRVMVFLNFRDFAKMIFTLVKVSVLCFILPGIVYFTMNEGWLRLTCLTLISCICTAIIIYCLGLTSGEKLFIKEIVSDKLERIFRHHR